MSLRGEGVGLGKGVRLGGSGALVGSRVVGKDVGKGVGKGGSGALLGFRVEGVVWIGVL